METYDWALANLMPGCNKQVFAVGSQLPLVDQLWPARVLSWDGFNGDRAKWRRYLGPEVMGLALR